METRSERRARIKRGLRKRLVGTTDRPRLCIYRSNTAIYAQVIDDVRMITLCSASSRLQNINGQDLTPIEKSRLVGKRVGELAKEVGVTKVVFDRNGFRYHGRIQALAEGAREAGLDF